MAELIAQLKPPGDRRRISGILAVVVVIQRVRVRWGADSRGSTEANVRSALPDVCPLPQLSDAPLAVHEVLMDEATGYQPRSEILLGEDTAAAVALGLTFADSAVTVARRPVRAAYPRRQSLGRLFTLRPGQLGRYRANFRFTGCACSPQWWYEQWTVHVAHRPVDTAMFLDANYAHDVDDRVHLYGGTARRGSKAAAA